MTPNHFKGILGPEISTPMTCQSAPAPLAVGELMPLLPVAAFSQPCRPLCARSQHVGASTLYNSSPLSRGNQDLPSFFLSLLLWRKSTLDLTSLGLGNRSISLSAFVLCFCLDNVEFYLNVEKNLCPFVFWKMAYCKKPPFSISLK